MRKNCARRLRLISPFYHFFWTGNRFRVILLVRPVRIVSHTGCTEKIKIDLREMFIFFIYIINKLQRRKCFVRIFIHSLQNFGNSLVRCAHSFVFQSAFYEVIYI